PLGKSVNQSSSPKALPVEFAHRVVRVHAVRAAAVGDDVGVLGQRSQLAAQLAERHRTGAGDVPSAVLGRGANVEHQHLAPLQAFGELVAVDDLNTVAVAQVGVGQPLDASDV